MKLFIAPHDDDQALFGAFTCIREKPVVVIVTDSHIHPKRGEIGCSAEERAKETEKANKILGCDTIRLGLPDDSVTEQQIEDHFVGLSRLFDYDEVYVPLLQGGNIHHDMVHRAATKVWGQKVVYYPTYTKTELYTEGCLEIKPSESELDLKKKALECYQSQIRINRPHFDAVLGKSEWLVGKTTSFQKLHLGCGTKIKEGWMNLDSYPYPGVDVVADATKRLPFDDNTFEEVYSEDFMEHLPQEFKIHIINEIWRVLKPGGTMEHYIPNAGSRNDFGSPSHLSHWNRQQFEHFDVDSYRWEKDRAYEGFIGGFRKVFSDLVNFKEEEDGVTRAQSIHVKYEKVQI